MAVATERTWLGDTGQESWLDSQDEGGGETDDDFEVSNLGDWKGDDTIKWDKDTGREVDSGQDEEFEASIVVPSFLKSSCKSDLLASLHRDPALETAKDGYSDLN